MSTPNNAVSQYSKPVLVGVGVTLLILPIIVVSIRFYARRRTRAGIGIDDWVILFALILCTGGGIVEILAAEIGGLGEHQRLGPHGELIHTLELTNYEKPGNYLDVGYGCRQHIHSTILSETLHSQNLQNCNQYNDGLVAAWTVAFTSAMAAQCSPTRYFRESFEIDYAPHCIHVQPMYQGLAISDLILDFLVLALPIPMVASLQMPWKTKIKVIDVLLLGSVVFGSGVARLVSFEQAAAITDQNPEAYFSKTSIIDKDERIIFGFIYTY